MTNSDFYARVPQEMKDLPRWVTWKLEPNEKGEMKKNLRTLEGKQASSTNPTTWTTFNRVKHLPPTPSSGIGFVFNGDGITGVDLDTAINSDGSIYERFRPILEYFKNCYIEVSPSGKGLHIIFLCKERVYYDTDKGGHNKKHIDEKGVEHGVEFYQTSKFFTVTGDIYARS